MVVYALIDPRTGRIRYVGLTGQPLDHRITGHLAPAAMAKTSRVAAWMRELHAAGLRPVGRVLEEVQRLLPGERSHIDRARRALATEREWIRYLVWLGADLTNTIHVLPQSAERRRRQSEAIRALHRAHREHTRAAHLAATGTDG